MATENAILNDEDILNEEFNESFDIDELEEKLQSQLDEDFADLEFLKEEKEKIGSPDALGKVVLDEVWKQFSNQIGLDITNQKGKEDTEIKIAAINQETSSLIKSLTKKVKYAYWIAGGSAGLAVIELILLVARVI